MEISQDSIKNATVETKTKMTDDLFRLLQVREKNEGMSKDWLLYLSSTPKFNKLTPGEIYQAFKMAISRDLKDSKNEDINLLPELSTNATGKVLTAYIEWKRANDAYQSAKDRLKLELSPKTEFDKTKIREEFLKVVFEDMQRQKFSYDAWVLYEELESRFSTPNEVKKRLYRLKMRQYLQELKKSTDKQGRRTDQLQMLTDIQLKANEGKLSGLVQNRCRAAVVCNYLKNCKTFQEFKAKITTNI